MDSARTCSRTWVPGNQEEWVEQILEGLSLDLEEDATVATIMTVPEEVREKSPLAFAPQVIALGPYHHWRPELYEMERYKISAARRIQQLLPSGRLDDIEILFQQHSWTTRSSYVRPLNFNDNTLSWMMVINSCFILEFLHKYKANEEEEEALASMSHLYGIPGKKSANLDVVRDMIMLENQLPLFLLQKLDAQVNASSSRTESDLAEKLTAFMKDLTPFRSVAVFPLVDITTTPRAHLLDVLYNVVVPVPLRRTCRRSAPPRERTSEEEKEEEEEELPSSNYIKQLLESAYKTLNIAPVKFVKRIVTSKPLKVVAKLPWNLIRSFLPQWFPDEGVPSSGEEEGNPPLVEEVLIPPARKLTAAGVKFRRTNGGLSTISFDKKTAKFSLPSITTDGTTEVVLRNLVAFESSFPCGPELVLSRYTELMNGLIDTVEDVEILRQRGIVNNRLRCDDLVAEMWNGMSVSGGRTRVSKLDKAIRDVNDYYDGKLTVKIKRLLKKYVYQSWRVLTLLAAVLLLLLNVLQAVCSVYSCGDWIGAPSRVMGIGVEFRL